MAGERVDRRLAAVLAADVAGYSRLMGGDEEGTLARLKKIRKDLVDPMIVKHRGRIVKTTGDGVLVEFLSAVDAVRAAVDIQRGMSGQSASVEQDRRLEFRIGIHLGDIIVDDDDIFGDCVNVAARLEATAEPGGVSMSDDAYRQVRGKVDIAYEDMGLQSLKNIAEPVQAWRVRLTDRTSSAAESALAVGGPQQLALPDKPSIAVLPFQNMSGDPEQEFFADGMVEDITAALSRFKTLFVIARNSSFTYKGKAVDVRQVGLELGVRYVLEGSVRKANNRVRITAQLIEAATRSHLWADRVEGDIEDTFALQDTVTTRVVGAIEPKLMLASMESVSRKPPKSWEGYDFYLRGSMLQQLYTPTATIEALQQFKQAIALDPTFGAAYAQAANMYYLLQDHFQQPLSDNQRLEALQWAEQATELAADDDFAVSRAAFVFAQIGKDYERAAELAHRAAFLNPNSSLAWNASGWMDIAIGDPDRALGAFARAARLNPIDPIMMPNILIGNSVACFYLRRHEEGIQWSKKALTQRPKHLYGWLSLANNCTLAGRLDEAHEAAAHLRHFYPNLTRTSTKRAFPIRNPEFKALFDSTVDRLCIPE